MTLLRGWLHRRVRLGPSSLTVRPRRSDLHQSIGHSSARGLRGVATMKSLRTQQRWPSYSDGSVRCRDQKRASEIASLYVRVSLAQLTRPVVSLARP